MFSGSQSLWTFNNVKLNYRVYCRSKCNFWPRATAVVLGIWILSYIWYFPLKLWSIKKVVILLKFFHILWISYHSLNKRAPLRFFHIIWISDHFVNFRNFDFLLLLIFFFIFEHSLNSWPFSYSLNILRFSRLSLNIWTIFEHSLQLAKKGYTPL